MAAWEDQAQGLVAVARGRLHGSNAMEQQQQQQQQPAAGLCRLLLQMLQGHVEAQYLMALCYLDGMGVASDEAHARRWFEEAAAQGGEFGEAATEELAAKSRLRRDLQSQSINFDPPAIPPSGRN